MEYEVRQAYGESFSSLMLASMSGNIELARSLMAEGADIHFKLSCSGCSPIMLASMNGHVSMVEQLLIQGADIHDKDKWGSTSIMVASELGKYEIVSLLLSKGARVSEKRIVDGYSPILLAAYYGHLEVAKILLANGANLHDKRSKDGADAIMIAAENRHIGMVKLLLANGANIRQLTNYGQSCYSVAGSIKIRNFLHKWPLTMGIAVLQDLGVYLTVTEAKTLIDLAQYVGVDDTSVDSKDVC